MRWVPQPSLLFSFSHVYHVGLPLRRAVGRARMVGIFREAHSALRLEIFSAARFDSDDRSARFSLRLRGWHDDLARLYSSHGTDLARVCPEYARDEADAWWHL